MRLLKKGLCIAVAALMICFSVTSAFAESEKAGTHKFVSGERQIENIPMKSFNELGSESSVSENIHRHNAEELPSSYSSVEQGYITSVKDQGNYGTCWAHATAAASEASLIKNSGYTKALNMSELHLSYFHYNNAYDASGMLAGDSTLIGPMYAYSDSFLDLGGSPFLTPFTLARWTSEVDEEVNTKYAYSNASSSFSVSDHEEAYSLSEAHLENMYWVSPQDKDDMKYMIMKYGAGTFSYYHYDSYYNDATAAYCNLYNSSTNHQVTVVGWDDNYSANNFSRRCRPTSDGAWLIKNSWDTEWGDNGYFWVSYEDTSALSSWSQFYSFGEADNFDKNYQYDGSSIFETEDVGNNAQIANVFTAESEEQLKAVSFFTAQNNIDYSIQVYTSLTDTNDPASGTPALSQPITGRETYCGYHTIELNEAVELKTGETFSVVIELTTEDDEIISLLVDKSDSWDWVVFTNSTQPGESFFKFSNSTMWVDRSANGINYRIKAFTDVTSSETPVYPSDDDTDSEELSSDDYLSSDDDSIFLDWTIAESFSAENSRHTVVAAAKAGDINGDARLTMIDVVILQKRIANLLGLTDKSKYAADFDGDLKLTMADVVLMQKSIAGL